MTVPPARICRFAGIDIGTLTCRLLIADLTPGSPLKELRSDRRILRLGEGVDHEKWKQQPERDSHADTAGKAANRRVCVAVHPRGSSAMNPLCAAGTMA